jgi:hypothetical protein
MTGTKIAATSGLAGASELRAIMQDSAVLPGNDAHARARHTGNGTLLPCSTRSITPAVTRKSAATHCWRRSHPANANTGRVSPICAWRSATSMAGLCRTSSTQMMSACSARRWCPATADC